MRALSTGLVRHSSGSCSSDPKIPRVLENQDRRETRCTQVKQKMQKSSSGMRNNFGDGRNFALTGVRGGGLSSPPGALQAARRCSSISLQSRRPQSDRGRARTRRESHPPASRSRPGRLARLSRGRVLLRPRHGGNAALQLWPEVRDAHGRRKGRGHDPDLRRARCPVRLRCYVVPEDTATVVWLNSADTVDHPIDLSWRQL
jgi:hypothetical protein